MTRQRGRARPAGRPALPLGLAGLTVLALACGGDAGPPGGAGADSTAPRAEAAPDTAATDTAPDTAAGRGAAAPAADSPTVPDPGSGTWVYACPDGYRFAVRFRDDSATVELVERDVDAARVPAASGARYEAGDVVYWSRGPEATLETGQARRVGCTGEPAATPWEKARLLGIAFRGLGQEPGWILDIRPGHWIRYNGDYGETRIVAPPAEPRWVGPGEVRYTTSTGGRTLDVVIRDEPCRDAMSGRPFSHTVTVTVDGETVRGCGRPLGDWPG